MVLFLNQEPPWLSENVLSPSVANLRYLRHFFSNTPPLTQPFAAIIVDFVAISISGKARRLRQ